MRMLVMVFLIFLSLIPLCHSDIASWVDENGIRHYSNMGNPGKGSTAIDREIASAPEPVNPTTEKNIQADRIKRGVYSSGGAEFGARSGNGNNHSTSGDIKRPQKAAAKNPVTTLNELCEQAKQKLQEAKNALSTFPYLDEWKSRKNKELNEQMKEYLKHNIRTRKYEMRQICTNRYD